MTLEENIASWWKQAIKCTDERDILGY